MQLPQGFKPVTLAQMLQHFSGGANVLGNMLWEHLHLTQEAAVPRIVTLEQQGLVQFAVSPDGEPSLFIAPKQIEGRSLYPTDEDHAFAERLVNFWDVTGKFDVRSGSIESAEATRETYIVTTPEGQVSLAGSVAQRLYKLGLITEDEKGTLHGPSKLKLMEMVQEQGICDFCSDPHPKHVAMVPNFDMPEMVGVPKSEGGWAACATCHQMISENRRSDLLRRAIEAMPGGRFTAAAIQGLHKRFWNVYDLKIEASGTGLALMDFIEDRISPEKEFVNPKLQDRSRRMEAIRRMTGLTVDEMQALEKGDVMHANVAQKLSMWQKKYGAGDAKTVQRIAEMLNATAPKLPPYAQPHWQQAFDRKIEACHTLAKWTAPRALENAVIDDNGRILSGIPSAMAETLDDMHEDLVALRVADIYSFNSDTMHAIMVAAASIPHEAPLRGIEIPKARAGWFWFSEPYPVASAPISSDYTHALLWTWDTQFKQPTLRFSAYVVNEKDGPGGEILPTTKWYWPYDQSFHEMLALNQSYYQKKYGPGGHVPEEEKKILVGEEATLKVVADLSLFFMQSCQWFRETVPGTKKKIDPKLTQEAGHIERHARKRYEKEFKEPPTVRVIALRKADKSISEEHVETIDAAGKRHLKVRHVVSGHHRLQPCGPGRKDIKLIWIDSYVKGPEDAPFQPPREKVFAVIR